MRCSWTLEGFLKCTARSCNDSVQAQGYSNLCPSNSVRPAQVQAFTRHSSMDVYLNEGIPKREAIAIVTRCANFSRISKKEIRRAGSKENRWKSPGPWKRDDFPIPSMVYVETPLNYSLSISRGVGTYVCTLQSGGLEFIPRHTAVLPIRVAHRLVTQIFRPFNDIRFISARFVNVWSSLSRCSDTFVECVTGKRRTAINQANVTNRRDFCFFLFSFFSSPFEM